MKKIPLHLLLILMLFSVAAFSIGLGEMTVRSYLNQPFEAEIDLIDIGAVPLSGIKASIAAVEDFKRIGMERSYILDLLTLKVVKNESGKPIIRIRSVERISEPYLEILVDLAWAKGQVYRAYTVLLDPPAYQLTTSKKIMRGQIKNHTSNQISRQPEDVSKKSIATQVEPEAVPERKTYQASSYGPTKSQETPWEIAQRYKTSDVSLQQVILGIVGENPDAFVNGNLNGLKTGITLTIPSTDIIRKIPENLAKIEVAAHEEAWRVKQPIKHVLEPPYTTGKVVSEMPEKPEQPESRLTSLIDGVVDNNSSTPTQGRMDYFTSFLPRVTSFLMPDEAGAETSSIASVGSQSKPLQSERLRTEMDIASAAIESVREANHVLNEQLHLLQAEHKKLQEKLAERDRELQSLKEQIRTLTIRQGTAGQAASDKPVSESRLWLWILMVIILLGGSGFAYWWFWMREQPLPPEEPLMTDTEPVDASQDEIETDDLPIEEALDASMESSDKSALDTVSESEIPEEQEEASTEALDVSKEDKEPPASEEAHVLEYEPGVVEHTEEDLPDEPPEKPSEAKQTEDNNTLEFVSASEPQETDSKTLETASESESSESEDSESEDSESEDSESEDSEFSKPVKSKRALDTLIDLARTYISMGDMGSAKQSLQEVMEHGSEEQQQAARELLNELDASE